MAERFKIEGLRELENRLFALGKISTRKSVGRRVLKKAGQPIADHANALAPNDPKTPPPDLHTSYQVSTRLNKSQARTARKAGKSAVEVYVGTSDQIVAVQQEFGNVHNPAQPHFRPAWDAEKMPTLLRIKQMMSDEIDKAVKRQAKRAAKG